MQIETVIAAMEGVKRTAEKRIAAIDQRLRPELIAEKRAEIQAWLEAELAEGLADGLEAAESARREAAKEDYERRRARGPQEGDWAEVAARSAWVQHEVDGLEVGALPQH